MFRWLQTGHGFWLQHSAPRFPQPAAGVAASDYSGVAPPERVFGQHFLCLSLGAGGVEGVAAALQTAFPLVYSWRMPAELRSTLPQASCGCLPATSSRSYTCCIRTCMSEARMTRMPANQHTVTKLTALSCQ